MGRARALAALLLALAGALPAARGQTSPDPASALGPAQVADSARAGGHVRIAQPAAAPPTYTLKRVNQGIAVDGVIDEIDWERTAPVYLVSPWAEPGQEGRNGTAVRMLWDGDSLYVAFVCDDPCLDAAAAGHDAAVHEGDAVEVAVAPDLDEDRYLAYAMNPRQALLDYAGSLSAGEWPVGTEPRWNSGGVRLAATCPGTLGDHGDADSGWRLEAAIPLGDFAPLGEGTPPQPGDAWRVGLGRLPGYGGKHGVWVDPGTPLPGLHAPAAFGTVVFSSELVSKRCKCEPRPHHPLK
ncbi:MAG: carbohydrate-binding family 9-like protein [Candidatus Latescibacterota bacterium]